MIIADEIRWNRKQLQGLKLLSDPKKKFIKFYGGSRSGKTFEIIRAIRIRALKYPGSKHLVARFSFANAKKTIWLQTMLPEFRKDEKLGLCKIIKDVAQVHYKNGSIVILGGLEPSSIDSVLAAEYGTIFITEANENRYEIIENLFSRLNDTSKDLEGNPIKLKFIIDLNPTVETSWTNVLFIKGLDPISKTPKANFEEYASLWFSPYDNEENLAKGYITTLENLSTAKRRRFLEGKYSSYEGLVFPVDEDVHIVDDFEIPANWKRIRAIDFGYTHPFVCLWLAYDKANDRAFAYREWIQTRWTVRAHAEKIKQLSILDLPEDLRNSKEAWRLAEKLYSATVCDHDAEDRATLEENGIGPVKPANKEVLAGIDNVIDLMDFENGKKPQVYIFRSLAGTRESLDSYRWRDTTMSNRGRAKDREVLKEDDDPADTLRYGLCEIFPIVAPISLNGLSLNLGSSWR
ncbi:phage terminase large subunit [Leptospira bandrabouensis]|uniref:phage terminase large subunit n=1 Tax=Leptospira bandrabouensis TaxID=2484903 RepID=UPI00223DF7DD|nr:phage terminase large subunit [Leptospira bandrabouensis]MCW7460164.1 phage terminase large subunit [Leptospira bandrabouensis]MCW7479319.1 phage terminase large subunit [Leptospira bandrabouensis]MCW7487001.1 phage terminase large subunit [Leptospira bandrabouensis]